MSIGFGIFIIVVIQITYIIISPILKEKDKRKAEERLAKKIAEEMKKEKEE